MLKIPSCLLDRKGPLLECKVEASTCLGRRKFGQTIGLLRLKASPTLSPCANAGALLHTSMSISADAHVNVRADAPVGSYHIENWQLANISDTGMRVLGKTTLMLYQ
jgi:hypothetical protein